MIPESWRKSEVAVVGMGRTGAAVVRWLKEQGARVYCSDISDTAELRSLASSLSGSGITVELGRHDLRRICEAALVIVSPGIPPSIPALQAARAAGVEIISELDLAARVLRSTKLIVVTGTNGKSTTTALIGHLLQAAGLSAPVAGNIGRPLIELASCSPPPEWVAVEASSFQLHDSPNLAPAMGVLTNLAPDHLDRYGSVEEYYADKKLLFRNAREDSIWVLNRDNEDVLSLARGVPGSPVYFSLEGRADAWYDRAARTLVLGSEPLMPRAELPLMGDHNVANALAAALAAQAAGLKGEEIAAGLVSFKGLPHRLEKVGEVDGVLFINDSKATNVGSTVVAVRAIDRPFVLILGGRPKGESFAPLAKELDERCRAVVAYGEAAPRIAAEIGERVRVEITHLLSDAVELARNLALPGDAVLLSPACASYDQFANYEERGTAFRRQVEEM
ncbi:UDP-N-acetylmuramoylalanine--D-glutamate ligase [bacterium HR33]|nr:UDP-N-acetylmuramoylalanine--D-glutamate ligase [bacterium HR33]